MLTVKADMALCSPDIGVSGIVLECGFNFKQILVIMLGFVKSSHICMYTIMLIEHVYAHYVQLHTYMLTQYYLNILINTTF